MTYLWKVLEKWVLGTGADTGGGSRVCIRCRVCIP